MTDDRIAGEWAQARGWIKEQWGKLTDDDLVQIDGRLEQLAGRVQERYGLAREDALREVQAWNRRNVIGR